MPTTISRFLISTVVLSLVSIVAHSLAELAEQGVAFAQEPTPARRPVRKAPVVEESAPVVRPADGDVATDDDYDQEPTPARRASADEPTRARRKSGPSAIEDEATDTEVGKRLRKRVRKEPALLSPSKRPKLVEPKDEANASESSAEGATDSQAANADARQLVLQAFQLTKTATSEEQFSKVIQLCRDGLQAGLDRPGAAYARKLMAWGFNRRGEARAKAGKDADGLKDFHAAVDLDDKHWRAVHNRGVSYATLGDYKRAVQDFDRTIEMNPDYPNAYFNRGELRYEEGDLAGAIQDYSKAIELSPRDAAAYNSRGHAQYRLGQYRAALDDYSRAVQLEPQNAAAYTNRGDAYADQGFYGQAARDYQTAIQIDPQLGRAYQSAAWLLATCPRREFRDERLAMNAAQKAIELDGEDDYRYLETLAAAQASAGQFEDAAKTQARILKLVPKQDVARHKTRLELYERSLPYREGESDQSEPSFGVSQRVD